MRIRTIPLLLALLVTAPSFAACGGGGGGPPPNRPPTASAGPDRLVSANATTPLAGSGSDPEGGPLAYRWRQVAGTLVKLSDPETASPIVITPPLPAGTREIVELQLVVTDDAGAEAVDTVRVVVFSQAMLAYLEDANGDALRSWAPPGGSSIPLVGPLPAGRSLRYRHVSPDGREIAFVSDLETRGLRELFVAAIDGTSVVKVNAPLGADGSARSPAWAPMGDRIAFQTLELQAPWAVTSIWTAKADGTDVRVVAQEQTPLAATERIVGGAQWSPDGSRIAYAVLDVGTDEVWIHTVDALGGGSALIRGPAGSGHEEQPRYDWSADGARLLVDVKYVGADEGELFTVCPDGTDRRTLADFPTSNVSWSPDGSHLAMLADELGGGGNELYSVRADGSGLVRVDEALLPSGGVEDYAFAPDGTRLAYVHVNAATGTRTLHVVGVEGTGHAVLSDPDAPGAGVTRFAWSPVATHVAYLSDEGRDAARKLFCVRADGSQGEILAAGFHPDGDVDGFRWSPEGQDILLTGDLDVDDQRDLYVVRPALGTVSRGLGGLGGADEDVRSVAWSCDSHWIRFTRHGPGRDDAMVVRPDGTGRVVLASDVAWIAWAPRS